MSQGIRARELELPPPIVLIFEVESRLVVLELLYSLASIIERVKGSSRESCFTREFSCFSALKKFHVPVPVVLLS